MKQRAAYCRITIANLLSEESIIFFERIEYIGSHVMFMNAVLSAGQPVFGSQKKKNWLRLFFCDGDETIEHRCGKIDENIIVKMNVEQIETDN